jgi:hypothetical protein
MISFDPLLERETALTLTIDEIPAPLDAASGQSAGFSQL